MTQREKRLLALVAAVVLLWGGNQARLRYTQWHNQAVQARSSAELALQQAKLQSVRAELAVEKLQEWRDRSLPSDIKVAQSQYRDWLIEQVKGAKLDYDHVKPSGAAARSGVRDGEAYAPLTFSILAEGTLQNVVTFLHRFYQSDQLHKITRMSLRPIEGGDKLRVDLTIEALSVQGTARPSGLSAEESDRLAHASLDDYLQRIEKREIFNEYVPPPPPRPPRVVREERPRPERRPPPPRFDDSQRAMFTGAVQGAEAGKLQAWVYVRTTGERYDLGEGDEFKIGQMEGRVLGVTTRELIIQTPDDVLAVKLGDSLRQGKPLNGSRAEAGS